MIIQEKVPAVAAAETLKNHDINTTFISNNSLHYKLARRNLSQNIVPIFNALQPSRVCRTGSCMTMDKDRCNRILVEQFNSLETIKGWLRTYKTDSLFSFQAKHLEQSLQALAPAAAEGSANA